MKTMVFYFLSFICLFPAQSQQMPVDPKEVFESPSRSFVFKDSLWSIQLAEKIRNPDNTVYLQAKIVNSQDAATWLHVSDNLPFRFRKNMNAVVFKDKIWLHGGENNPRSTHIWYSDDGRNWAKTTKPLPENLKRFGFEWIVFNGKLWAIGGRSDRGSAEGFNSAYCSENGEDWTLATNQIATNDFPYFSKPKVLVFKGKMYIFGGLKNDFGDRNQKYVYSSYDGANWEVYDFPFRSVRLGHAHAFFVHDERIWIKSIDFTEYHAQYREFNMNISREALAYSRNGRDWHIYSDINDDPFLKDNSFEGLHFTAFKGETLYYDYAANQVKPFREKTLVSPFLPDQYVMPSEVATLDVPFEVKHLTDPSVTRFDIKVHSTNSDLIAADEVSVTEKDGSHFLRLSPTSPAARPGMSTALTISASNGEEARKQHFVYAVIENKELYLFPIRDNYHSTVTPVAPIILLGNYLSNQPLNTTVFSLTNHSNTGIVTGINKHPLPLIKHLFYYELDVYTTGREELIAQISNGQGSFQQRVGVVVSEQPPPDDMDRSSTHAFSVDFSTVPANVLPVLSFAVLSSSSEESSSTNGATEIMIDIDPAPTSELNVNVNVGGTAVETDNYHLGNGLASSSNPRLLAIPPNSFTASFTITPVENSLDNNEAVVLTLEDGTGYMVGQKDTHTFTITGNGPPVGIFSGSDVIIYPNPSPGTVRLQWNAPEHAYNHIRILDLSGKPLLSYPIDPSNAALLLPLHELSPGVYILNMEGEGKTSLSRRLVRE